MAAAAALTSSGAAAAALCGEICSDFFCSRAITLRKRSALTSAGTLVISCNRTLKYRWSELMSIFRIVMSDSIYKMSSTNVWTSEESGPAVGCCPESAISIDALRRSGYYLVNQLLQSPTLLRKRLLGKFKRIVEDWIIWSILDNNGFWINGPGHSKKDSKTVVKT
jgi:hypothetical protein